MASIITFYFSNVKNCRVIDENRDLIGRLKDLEISSNQARPDDPEPYRPEVLAIVIKTGSVIKKYAYSQVQVNNKRGRFSLQLEKAAELRETSGLSIGKVFLDRQIVDMNGRKVVRVNDVRFVSLSGKIYTLAVDVGIEGLLRRLGVDKPVKAFFSLLRIWIPAKFIMFDDVATVDISNFNIKLSKTISKLHTMHPSDIADILEELGKESRTTVFSILDEEKAADVLEEMEPLEQVLLIESLPIEKAADVLEKMPANEAADLIDELESDKAELLLKEMEHESSEEVRELLEYPDTTVGRLMTTEVLAFNEQVSIEGILDSIREKKPEMEMLYNIFIVDRNEKLIATLSLRDLLISMPGTPVKDVMKRNPVSVCDDDKIGSLAEIISKYNLLALPVVDNENRLEGMVVIDDVIEDLLDKRRTT